MYKWVTQKNIEAEEKWVQKKEELVKEIKENNFSGRLKSNSVHKYLDFYSTCYNTKFMPVRFC